MTSVKCLLFLQQLQASQLQQPPPHTHSPPGSTQSQPLTSQSAPDQGEATQIADQPNQPNNRPQNLQLSSDSIWGPTSSNQTTPSVVSPGPWSPAATSSAARVWDMEQRYCSSNKIKKDTDKVGFV